MCRLGRDYAGRWVRVTFILFRGYDEVKCQMDEPVRLFLKGLGVIAH